MSLTLCASTATFSKSVLEIWYIHPYSTLSEAYMNYASMRFATAIMLLLSLLYLLPTCAAKQTSGTALHVAFTDKGVTSLKYQGVELLANGVLQVKHLTLSNFEGVGYTTTATPRHTRIVLAKRTITQDYSWGSVSCVYAIQDNRLLMTVNVSNTSKRIISGILLQPLALRFPQGINGFDQGFRRAHNVEEPSAVGIDAKNAVVALVNEQFGEPLYIGFPASVNEKDPRAIYPVLISTTADAVFPRKSPQYPNMWLDFPNIDRPIYPGRSDTFNLSLRFAPAGTAMTKIAGDIYHKFADAYPRTVKWADRRPLGMIFFGGSELRDPKVSPRGFYIATQHDINTPEGRAEFKQKLLESADRAVKVLKSLNCQGVLIWDIEGYEFPATYIGDPRDLGPEMDEAIDAFMQKFRDAGLRVGVTLRPQYAGRMLYSNSVQQAQLVYPERILEDKIAYAKKRWGCSMFYVDSNSNFYEFGRANDEAAYRILPATVFETVAKANPDILLIPEHENTRYYAYTAPYNELRQGYTGTPEMVKRVYPDAFSIIRFADVPASEHWKELVAAVKHGDIMLVHVDTMNEKLDTIHQDLLNVYKDARK